MANAVATLVVKVVSDVKDATGGLDDVASRSDKMKRGLSTAAKAATGVLIGLGAAMVSAGNAAAEDAKGQAILAQTMKNATGASAAQIAATEDWISSMSAATGVADDQLRPALGNLVRATGDVSKSQDAMKVALDVSAATGADLEAVTKALAKGYGGQTTAIGRLVPGIDKAVLASGDMSAVMDELAAKTGGSAAAAADTAAGRMQRMKVSMDEAKESIGAGLLPIMGKFADVLAKVGKFAQEHSRSFQILVAVLAALAAATIAANAALSVATAVTAAWTAATTFGNSTLGIRIGLLALDAANWVRTTAAVIANTAATIASNIASKAMALGLAVVTAAQWAWNAALSANPIGLIIIAVIALVAAIVLLWKKSSTFRSVMTAIFNAIKTVAVAAFNAIKNAGLTVFNWLRANWPLLLAILTGPIGLAVLAIAKNWDKIKAGFQAVKDRIATIAGTLKDIITKPFDLAATAVGKVSSAVSTMIGWFGRIVAPSSAFYAPFNAAKTAVDALIGAVKSLIGWLKSIKVPKIHIPNPFGRSAAPSTATVPTATGLARTPVVPFAGAPSARATGTGPTIVVNGALDPEAVARQIQRILSGHSRRIGLAS